jgi:hypothetical protein
MDPRFIFFVLAGVLSLVLLVAAVTAVKHISTAPVVERPR